MDSLRRTMFFDFFFPCFSVMGGDGFGSGGYERDWSVIWRVFWVFIIWGDLFNVPGVMGERIFVVGERDL